MEESSFLNPTKTLEACGLVPGIRVVDLGAGSGFFTRAAGRLIGPKGSVFAVDINSDLLTRIKNLSITEGLQNIEIFQGNIEAEGGTGLPAKHFDFCIATNVLFSLESKHVFLQEISRVLKPGGKALLVDWRGSFGGLGPHEGHVVTVGAARDLVEKEGLLYVQDVSAGEYHWGMLIRKKV